MKQSFWWPFFLAFLAGGYALIGSGESLWLDELHSSWVISGGLAGIGQRAAEGNQSPVYFWLLWLVDGLFHRTLGIELSLRVVSILAWSATIGLVARSFACGQLREENRDQAAYSIRRVASVAVVAWIMLDRIQLFYASEARVYALVQLVSFCGWLLVAKLVAQPTESRPSRWSGLLLGWYACSMLLIYLHLTAGLAVLTQWVFLSVWAGARASRKRLSLCLLAGLAIAVASLPAVIHAQPVWERREQWASFAGDASVWNALALFPLLAILAPILIARIAERLATATAPGTRSQSQGVMWGVAILGPWCIAWIATGFDIAPIFHRRFVIVMAVPIIMLAATQWQRLRSTVIRWTAFAGVLVWLLISQGTPSIWRQGELLGWQRGEGWREATRWVERRIAAEDQLWVASGLIEGRSATLPIGEALDRYLAFPLRGGYRVRNRLGAEVQPHALVNDWRLWGQQWREANGVAASPPVQWIVFRGSADGLDRILNQLVEQSSGGLRVDTRPQAFGRVCVASIQQIASSSAP